MLSGFELKFQSMKGQKELLANLKLFKVLSPRSKYFSNNRL
jgi:hypothetical protein